MFLKFLFGLQRRHDHHHQERGAPAESRFWGQEPEETRIFLKNVVQIHAINLLLISSISS